MDIINPQTFEMLLDRFDKLDSQVGKLQELLRQHASQDEEYYKQTIKHKEYFKVIWTGFAAIGGLLVALWGSVSTKIVEAILK